LHHQEKDRALLSKTEVQADPKAAAKTNVLSHKFSEHCSVYVYTSSVVKNKEFFWVLGCRINVCPQGFAFIWSKGGNVNESCDIRITVSSIRYYFSTI
jgi:hypothetical protein